MFIKMNERLNKENVEIVPVVIRKKALKSTANLQFHSADPGKTNYALVMKDGCGYIEGTVIYIDLGAVGTIGDDTLGMITFVHTQGIKAYIELDHDEETITIPELAKEIQDIKDNPNKIITNNKIGGEGISTSAPSLVL